MNEKQIKITKEDAKIVIDLVDSIYSLGYTDEEALILKIKLEKLLQDNQE